MTDSKNAPRPAWPFAKIPSQSALASDNAFNGVNHQKARNALKKNAEGRVIPPRTHAGLVPIDRQVFRTYSRAGTTELSQLSNSDTNRELQTNNAD